MKSLHNIEKSSSHRGEYVGYARGPWRITKHMDGWAMRPEPNCDFFGVISQVRRTTLAAMSAELENLNHVPR